LNCYTNYVPRPDYSGPFDPELRLSDLSRQALADLGREYLLNGHLQDRVGLPEVMGRFGDDAMTQIAIEEWMSASPIYSKRTQRALNFVGNDVSTIFKNIQLDIGAAHQFMDFRFRLDNPAYGEFWLQSCGALMDVEPFGEQRVRAMCHDIEDPTFDATAAATHPCAKVRPIHRPPRIPAHRVPHCRWKVFIDEEAVPFAPHENLDIIGRSKIANVDIDIPGADAEPGGWADYSGPFDPEFQLEDLSHRALLIANQEFAVQSHLLARAFLLCSGRRFGDDVVPYLARKQWTGIAGLTAERLKSAMKIEGDGIDAIAKVFQLHPAFHPRTYVDFRIEVAGPSTAHIEIGPCPALEEGDPYCWFAHLEAEAHPALSAIARAVNAHARCLAAGERAWDVVIDPSAPPLPEPPEVQLAKISGGSRIVFQRRRPLRR
jgi:hypothetical protein